MTHDPDANINATEQQPLEQPTAATQATAGDPAPQPSDQPRTDDEGPEQTDDAQTTAADDEGAKALQMIKESVSEDDPKPSPTLTLRKILGGDILTAHLVRSQIWLFVLIVLLTVVYVAFRYQCQQDFITIDRLENELKDAKYKALSISSALTERCRESHILEMLKANEDSLLMPSDQPPYIINIPEQ